MSDTASPVLLPHLEEGNSEEGLSYLQFREMREVGLVLERHFPEAEDYVASDQIVYYDRRDRRRSVRPDVMVVRGVPGGTRPGYYPWRWGKGPDWVLEIASETTASRDREEKPIIYRSLGVAEHFLFDPEGMHHDKVLTGFALTPDGYVPIPENDRGRVPSRVLGLEFAPQEYLVKNDRCFHLRVYRPGEDLPLPLTDELLAQKDAALAAMKREIEELRRCYEGERGT